MSYSQEWVLARWREEVRKVFPVLYTVEQNLWRSGMPGVYISVVGNEEWHLLKMKDKKLVDVLTGSRVSVKHQLSSGQLRKIEGLFQ